MGIITRTKKEKSSEMLKRDRFHMRIRQGGYVIMTKINIATRPMTSEHSVSIAKKLANAFKNYF